MNPTPGLKTLLELLQFLSSCSAFHSIYSPRLCYCGYLLHGVPHKVVPLIIKVQLSLMPKSSNLLFREKVCRNIVIWCNHPAPQLDAPRKWVSMPKCELGIHSRYVLYMDRETGSSSSRRKCIRKGQKLYTVQSVMLLEVPIFSC